MKTAIYKISLLLVLILMGKQSGFGQEKGSLFIGLGPDITKEKDYEKGEFDVNVLPFDIQYYLSKTIALKASAVVNLHVADRTEISQVGGQLAVPIYFLRGTEIPFSGIYLAPLFGWAHNYISQGNEITAAAEAGYTWITPGGFTLNLGLQLGGSYFTARDETAGWRNHSGLKFRLGYTF